MKKTIALGIIAVFIFSIVPITMADNDSDRTGIGIKSGVNVNAGALTNENGKGRRDMMNDTLQKMQEKNTERVEKIAELDQRQMEKLSRLGVRNAERIANLKGERLQRIMNLSETKLERISELDKEKIERISELNESDMQKFSSLNRARLKELSKLDFQTLKMELKGIKIRKVKNAHDLDARNITQSIILSARADFEAAKEKFKESKNGLENAREKLKESKEKHDDNATLENAREYLLKASDALISHLEKIKAKVQENSNIQANVSARIVLEIDAQIADINSIKADVQSAATKQQIKDYAAKLRAKWNTLQHLIEIYSKRVVSARVEGMVNQGLVLEKRLEHVLQEAKDKNISIDVSAEVDVFSQKIAESKAKYIQAQAKISEALDLRANGEPADSSKIKSLADQANQLLKDSRDLLKQAYDELKVIVKKIKEAYPSANLSENVEVEVEETNE